MRARQLLVLDETEDLSVQVEHVVTRMRPRPSVTWCDSFESLAKALAEDGPCDLIVAGPVAVKPPGLRRLRELREASPHTQLLLAVDHLRSTDLRDTVRAGAVDILRLPVKDAPLFQALEQALEAGSIADVARQDGSPTPAAGPGTIVAIVSGSGGSGKTFLAINAAYHLQSVTKKRTCLIDLDLQFGELSTALRLKPRPTIYDLLCSDADDHDAGLRLEEHMQAHDSGVRLLAAPEDPEQGDFIDGSQIADLLETARSRFDYVIVDTPTVLNDAVLVALEHADQILVLATLDLPSVRNLGVMLSTLKKLKVPPERLSLIINKVEPDVGIDVARVQQYFPQPFSMVVPYGTEVNRSLNMGQPVLAYAPRGEVSKTLASGLARTITAAASDDERPEPRHRRAWSRRKAG